VGSIRVITHETDSGTKTTSAATLAERPTRTRANLALMRKNSDGTVEAAEVVLVVLNMLEDSSVVKKLD
jgi:hypothetical protein